MTIPNPGFPYGRRTRHFVRHSPLARGPFLRGKLHELTEVEHDARWGNLTGTERTTLESDWDAAKGASLTTTFTPPDTSAVTASYSGDELMSQRAGPVLWDVGRQVLREEPG